MYTYINTIDNKKCWEMHSEIVLLHNIQFYKHIYNKLLDKNVNKVYNIMYTYSIFSRSHNYMAPSILSSYDLNSNINFIINNNL